MNQYPNAHSIFFQQKKQERYILNSNTKHNYQNDKNNNSQQEYEIFGNTEKRDRELMEFVNQQIQGPIYNNKQRENSNIYNDKQL